MVIEKEGQERLDGVVVRPFRREDIGAVRHISCATLNKGEPWETLISDHDIIADALTRYFTDFEPESTWVAQSGEKVVGYLTACLRPGRYFWISLFRIAPGLLGRAFLRGVFFKKGIGRLLGVGAKVFLLRFFAAKPSLKDYPAELHINLLEGFRGQGIGRQLIDRLMGRLKQEGVPGVHASVHGHNETGQHFFHRSGFSVLGRLPGVEFDGPRVRPADVILFGRKT
jgi:ribosomal protein S18 acetylase RimI-like enzyme